MVLANFAVQRLIMTTHLCAASDTYNNCLQAHSTHPLLHLDVRFM